MGSVNKKNHNIRYLIHLVGFEFDNTYGSVSNECFDLHQILYNPHFALFFMSNIVTIF